MTVMARVTEPETSGASRRGKATASQEQEDGCEKDNGHSTEKKNVVHGHERQCHHSRDIWNSTWVTSGTASTMQTRLRMAGVW